MELLNYIGFDCNEYVNKTTLQNNNNDNHNNNGNV